MQNQHKPKSDFDQRASAEMERHLETPDWSQR